MKPSDHFRFCPSCGKPSQDAVGASPFVCGACGFTFFFNAATAAAVFLRREDGKALFIRRARDPGKGRLAPPGGFVDIGERAEVGVRREVREEVGLEMDEPRFLASFKNSYFYRGVTYPTLDLFFWANAVEPETARSLEDVDGFCWLDPMKEVTPADMAFESMGQALEVLRERWAGERLG